MVFPPGCVGVVGKHTYGQPSIYTMGNVRYLTIGSFCSIASGVKIYLDGRHEYRFITTYPFDNIGGWGLNPDPDYGLPRDNVVIGNDVWIGTEAVIMSGSVIEDGCVVGANSVVRGRVSAYSVVIGNPCVVMRKRFSDEQIQELLRIRWWDWDDEKIRSNVSLLMSLDIQGFIENHKSLNAGD